MKNKILTGSTVLFILSLFMNNSLIVTICLTLFVISVFICCLNLWKIPEIFIYLFYKSESNPLKEFINVFTIPMVIIGAIMVVINLVYMWNMVLK